MTPFGRTATDPFTRLISRLPVPVVLALRRWPTLLAVALTVAGGWGASAAPFAQALVLLPMAYTVLLALDRRWTTWPVVGVALVGFVLLHGQDAIDTQAVVLVIAATGLAASVVRGRGRREVFLQGTGLVVFGGLAVLGAHAAPEVAVWVVALGWLGHGVWDFWHLHRDAVVARSFAEWCGVVDVLVAVQLLAAPAALVAASWAS